MSKLTPKFFGEVDDKGKLEIFEKDKFEMFIASLTGKVEIVVKKFKKNRSVPQNSYLWGVVYKLISDHTGYESADLHNHFKAHFLKKKVGGLTTFYSTTKLDTLQFGEYIEKIKDFAAKRLDVHIPDPDEIDLNALN